MNYDAIVKMMWLADIVNGIGTFICVAVFLGMTAIVGYGCFAYFQWDNMYVGDCKDILLHKIKVRIVSGLVIIMFFGIIGIVIPSKNTIYVAAGANLAEQIEKNTDIPKRIDTLLDAIEINLKNNSNPESK
jgi:hypothetical protein